MTAAWPNGKHSSRSLAEGDHGRAGVRRFAAADAIHVAQTNLSPAIVL
ncbi:MAG TPA: hypothetical protein VEK15_27860 [Vicinamibacteria bacterium]|nr:hypothetical protein [Vicinamibacteria bacterium]